MNKFFNSTSNNSHKKSQWCIKKLLEKNNYHYQEIRTIRLSMNFTLNPTSRFQGNLTSIISALWELDTKSYHKKKFRYRNSYIRLKGQTTELTVNKQVLMIVTIGGKWHNLHKNLKQCQLLLIPCLVPFGTYKIKCLSFLSSKNTISLPRKRER